MTHMKLNTYRRIMDPAALTPQEKQIFDLWQKGMGPKEISLALGRPSPSNVSMKLTIIKEKLACQ